jgi:hypothetical protein
MENTMDEQVEMQEKYSQLFEALNIDTSLEWPSFQQVKMAFKENLKVLHPDKGGDSEKVSHISFSK